MSARPIRRSIRYSLALTIGLMGLLALALALLTGEWYKKLVFENEQRTLTELLAYEAEEDLEKHEKIVKSVAQPLQRSPQLRDAIRQADSQRITNLLNDQFHQYFVTAGRIDLLRLTILTPDYQLLAHSTEDTGIDPDIAVCSVLLEAARSRQGPERLQALSDYCTDGRNALHALMLPIGGLRPIGYLVAMSNPAPSLEPIEKELQSPIEMRLTNGRYLKHAQDWSEQIRIPSWARADYVLRSSKDEQILTLRIFKDANVLLKSLNKTRLTIAVTITLITLLAMLLSFSILRRNLLRPLDKLTEQLERIRSDRSHLGEQISVRGNSEFERLAASFNGLSSELKTLYTRLEEMAFSDPLTKLPNRAWFHDNLKHLCTLADRGHGGFALLFLDLNKFKPINDTLGHQVGDQVLVTISERIHATLRGSDYLARVNREDEPEQPGEALARMGGDEFAVLLPMIDRHEEAQSVAEKIVRVTREPILLEGNRLELGVSIGIALYPQDADSIEQLVYRADLAMYAAKENGLDVTHYGPELEADADPNSNASPTA